MLRTAGILLTVFAMACFGAASASAAETKVLVMGDSWADAMHDNLDKQPASMLHGSWDVRDTFDVLGVPIDLGIPGSTAEAFKEPAVRDWVINVLNVYPDIRAVVISLGGNDLHARYGGGGTADPVFDEIEADLRVIVQDIVDRALWNPKIVLAGYDILKFDMSAECAALACTLFGPIDCGPDPLHPVVQNPEDVNLLYLEVGNRQQAVADDYAQVTYLSLWGTGQGSPGDPDPTKWATVLNYMNDCIHLSESGYDKFTKEMYCRYFAPDPEFLGVKTCAASPCGVAVQAEAAPDSGSLPALLLWLACVLAPPVAAAACWRRRLG